ncbi:MAG: hypothetical protein ACYCW6_03045 [Candidatus Xenobia bacterium]
MRRLPLLLLAATLLLSGCSGYSSFNGTGITPAAPIAQAEMNTTSGQLQTIPTPNDLLLRDPKTGQNNLPGTGEPIASFNSLSGFSTSGTISIPFVGGVSANSVTAQSVLVIDTTTGLPVAVTSTVTNDNSGNSTINLLPVKPLAPSHQFLVIVTPAVVSSGNVPVSSDSTTQLTKQSTPLVDGSGNSLVNGLSNAQAQQLEPLRQAYQAIWAAAEKATGLNRSVLAQAFVFTTQQLFQTMQQLAALAAQQTPAFTPDATNADNSQGTFVGATAVGNFYNSTTNNTLVPGFSSAPHNAIGSIFTGTFTDPNFIADPVKGPFVTNANGQLVQQGTNTIRINVYLPAAGTAPFQCVVFQHGLGRTKLDTGLIANSLCTAGFGVVAMDLVLHGDRSLNPTLTTANGVPGLPAGSGTDFINLNNVRVSRDNIRQSVFDQMVLTQMVANGSTAFPPNQTPQLSPVGITYGGQSLGGIVGDVYLTMEPLVQLGVLNVPGGRLTGTLLNSQTISPQIIQGLQANGIQQGTANFNNFFFITQTVVDDADPFNYGAHTLAGDLKGNKPTSLLFQEMIGDVVVPNSSGNDLAVSLASGPVTFDQVNAITAILGLTQVTSPLNSTSGLFQFQSNPAGDHGFLLDGKDATLTGQAQTQFVTFLGSGLKGQTVIQHPVTAVPTGVDLTVQHPEHLILLPQH